MYNLSWMTLIVLILAVYRLTRLFVFDQITSFIRRPFLEEIFTEDENGRIVALVRENGGHFHTFMRNLLSCYWCVGIWSSIAVVSVYMALPPFISYPVLLILALAGASGIIESFVKG